MILKPYLVTSEELIAVGWNREVVTDEMIDELNRVLYEYDIININSIRHFIAQCSHESDDWGEPGYGDGLMEIGDDADLREKNIGHI